MIQGVLSMFSCKETCQRKFQIILMLLEQIFVPANVIPKG